jgi:hypothetical protein
VEDERDVEEERGREGGEGDVGFGRVLGSSSVKRVFGRANQSGKVKEAVLRMIETNLIRGVVLEKRPDSGQTVLHNNPSLDPSLLEDDIEKQLKRSIERDDLLQIGVRHRQVVKQKECLVPQDFPLLL